MRRTYVFDSPERFRKAHRLLVGDPRPSMRELGRRTGISPHQLNQLRRLVDWDIPRSHGDALWTLSFAAYMAGHVTDTEVRVPIPDRHPKRADLVMRRGAVVTVVEYKTDLSTRSAGRAAADQVNAYGDHLDATNRVVVAPVVSLEAELACEARKVHAFDTETWIDNVGWQLLDPPALGTPLLERAS